jgi:hypothetical protein
LRIDDNREMGVPFQSAQHIYEELF